MTFALTLMAGLALVAGVAAAQPAAEPTVPIPEPQNQWLAKASQRLDQAFRPLCRELSPQGRCAPMPFAAERRGLDSVDEHNSRRTGLFSGALAAFQTEPEVAALLAQHAAFAILWERSAGRVFTSVRRNYFAASDAVQADAAALAALYAAGYDPGAYLPTLLKVRSMLLAQPPVAVYHNTPQPGLLSSAGEVSDERRQSIEQAVTALRSGGFAAYLAALKVPESARILGVLATAGHTQTAGPLPDVSDLAQVPYLNSSEARSAYERWLQRPLPRAFVVHPGGHWSASWGRPDASERALRSCVEKRSADCALYAVDNTVVWQVDPARRITLDRLVPAARP